MLTHYYYYVYYINSRNARFARIPLVGLRHKTIFNCSVHHFEVAYVVSGTHFSARRAHGARETKFFPTDQFYLPRLTTYFIEPRLKTVVFRSLM